MKSVIILLLSCVTLCSFAQTNLTAPASQARSIVIPPARQFLTLDEIEKRLKAIEAIYMANEFEAFDITCPNPTAGASNIRTMRHYSMGADSVQICRLWINDVPVLPLTLSTTGTGAATFTPSTGVLNVPTPSASGTVTSVGVTSSNLTVSGSPVTSSGNISVSLPNVVTAGTYEFLTVDATGRVTAGYNSSTSEVTKSLNTAYQASNTSRTYDLTFSVSTVIGAGLISTSNGNIDIQISANGSTGWTSRGIVVNGNSGVLAAQNTQGVQILALDIPAGYYYRILATTVSGTVNSTTPVKGFETLRR